MTTAQPRSLKDRAYAASAYIAEHDRRWLDSPIPDPSDWGDSDLRIAAPREQLLKELGLA